jgi:hypothetical protein
MRITQILPGLYHFDFDRIWEMCKHLGRMQEHAEHPKFYKQIFSRSRVKAYYHGQGTEYNKSALGFNIPGWAFESFWNELFVVNKHERRVLEQLEHLGLQAGSRFYVISTADGSALKPSENALDHEIAHGLWYTNILYRDKAQAILEANPVPAEGIRRKISQWGIYTPEVLDDEVHAYLGTDSPSRLAERFKLGPECIPAHEGMAALLKEYKS